MACARASEQAVEPKRRRTTSVEVILRDPGLTKRMGGGEIPTSRAEKAIQTIRKLLREKKALAT